MNAFFSFLGGTTVQAMYNETISKTMVKYTALTYCETSSLEDFTCPLCKNLTNTKLVDTVDGEIKYIILDDEELGSKVVAFRGSSDVENWLTDFDAIRISPYPDKSIEVHEGFYHDFMKIRNDIYDIIGADKFVFITGHSYGAALAALLAFDVKYVSDLEIDTELYTYGKPRIGNIEFAKSMSALNHFRMTNKKDIVPHVPMESLGFVHSNTEVWYKNEKEYTICSTFEDDKCSNSCAPLSCVSTADHTSYLGQRLGSGSC